MSLFLLRRLAAFAATLLAASVVVFLVLEILPGDVAQTMMGPDASPEAVRALAVSRGAEIGVAAAEAFVLLRLRR